MNRIKEDISELIKKQIKLKYKEAGKKAELTSIKDIFYNLCNKYQNLLLTPISEDLKDIIVDAFALIIKLQKDTMRY